MKKMSCECVLRDINRAHTFKWYYTWCLRIDLALCTPAITDNSYLEKNRQSPAEFASLSDWSLL
jgi:hypothetical protein